MTEQQQYQAVQAASNLHAMVCQRMMHEQNGFGFHGTAEVTAWLAACRLLSKVFNEAYDEVVDKT